MPRPTEMLGKGPRKVALVGHAPNRVQAGVALTDGESYFEVIGRWIKDATPWVKLENMELKVGAEFRLEDCYELRIAGNAANIKEQKGW